MKIHVKKLIAELYLLVEEQLKHIKQLVEYITVDTRIDIKRASGNSTKSFKSIICNSCRLVMNSIDNKSQSAVRKKK
jgi:hypothetical protein